jgi:sigma-B regulation protein RsbU (phosphoserine phosphatase)
MTAAEDIEIAAKIVERLPDPALLLDRELRLVRYNPAFVTFSELRPRRLDSALSDAGSVFTLVGDPRHADLARDCMASARATRLEDVEVQAPGGTSKIAIVAFVPVASASGEAIGLIYSLRDVTGDVEIHKRYKTLLKAQRDRVRLLEEREQAVKEDLLEAKLFQESLLPEVPERFGFRFATRFLPAELVSGDLYDIHRIPGGARVMVADATGHGVQASLRTMVIRTAYLQIRDDAPHPGAVLSALSRWFLANYSTQVHFTACCFDVVRDIAGVARLKLASAGHPGLIRLSAGLVSEVSARGPFPGIALDGEFEVVEQELASGDRILGFTDGLTGQQREDGTRFAEERLSVVLEGTSGSIGEAVDRAIGEVIRFLGGDRQSDDITLIGVEVE